MAAPIFAITIPGDPVGKQRPRLSARGGHARAYTAKATREWESDAARRMAEAHGPHVEKGPLMVVVRAVKDRPQRLMRKRDPEDRIWRTVKPDADNVGKSALDALEKAGVIANDSEVAVCRFESLFTALWEDPCVEIEVYELESRS